MSDIGFFSNEMIGIVGSGDNYESFSQREVRLCRINEFSKRQPIMHKKKVIRGYYCKDQYAIVCEDKTYIHQSYIAKENKPYLKFSTENNPRGIAALSRDPEISIALILGQVEGRVKVVNLADREVEKQARSFEAFKGQEITALALSTNGKLIAVASNEGCTIRIFDTKSLTLVREFLRGRSPAIMDYLSFENDDSQLVVSSEKGTIHIFLVGDDDEKSN